MKWFTYAVAEHEIYLRRIIVNSHEMEIANKRKKRIIEFEKDEQKAKKEF